MSGSTPDMLIGEQRAAAAHAGLHFIDDQQQPCSLASARKPCMNSREAGITPPSPCTGSSMTATVLSVISSRAGQVVQLGLGKPSPAARNIVSQPALPEADMVASVRPWKLWSKVMIS